MKPFLTLAGAWTVLTVLLTVGLAGCETGPRAVETMKPSLNLTASSQRILTGETTTLFAETANLLGRDVEMRWSTTLGRVEPSPSGRMARFTSDQAGTAVVTAEMRVNGEVLRDQINITVNAIR